MTRRAALGFLAIASPLLLVLFSIPWRAAEVVFALLAMAYPVALIVVALDRDGRLAGRRAPLALLLVFLELCTAGMLLLRGRVLEGPWLGGLPLAAAIQLYGVFLAPLLLVALAYALTFERYELRAEDLERLEKLVRDREEAP